MKAKRAKLNELHAFAFMGFMVGYVFTGFLSLICDMFATRQKVDNGYLITLIHTNTYLK